MILHCRLERRQDRDSVASKQGARTDDGLQLTAENRTKSLCVWLAGSRRKGSEAQGKVGVTRATLGWH